MKINQIFKCLSHPIRRDIISRLHNGPLTAGDLAENYDVTKPTMSTHFTALKEADLVYTTRDGVTIFYHLNLTASEEALSSILELLGTGAQKKQSSVLPTTGDAKS